jgi:Fe-S oxidoreductase
LFPEISIATMAMLYYSGIRIVFPPEFLCCGYPLAANGRVKSAETKSYENRVIFHRMASLIGYMDIHDLVISCGTCFEMLQNYQIDNIFPGSTVIDINEFIARENLYSSENNDRRILYHGPCHSPLKHQGPLAVFNKILGSNQIDIPFCCGEGGTLALSTPQISNVLRTRKKNNIQSENIMGEKNITVLTTCPSCVQGLSRIRGEVNVQGKSLIVCLAELFLGKKWGKRFLADLKKSKGIERIIY